MKTAKKSARRAPQARVTIPSRTTIIVEMPAALSELVALAAIMRGISKEQFMEDAIREQIARDEGGTR